MKFVQGKDAREDIILSKYVMDLSETSRGADLTPALCTAELRETKKRVPIISFIQQTIQIRTIRRQISSHHINISIYQSHLKHQSRDDVIDEPRCTTSRSFHAKGSAVLRWHCPHPTLSKSPPHAGRHEDVDSFLASPIGSDCRSATTFLQDAEMVPDSLPED